MRDLLAAACLSLAAAGAADAGRAEDKVVDDYPKALATARDRRVPIFVDVWAPW